MEETGTKGKSACDRGPKVGYVTTALRLAHASMTTLGVLSGASDAQIWEGAALTFRGASERGCKALAAEV